MSNLGTLESLSARALSTLGGVDTLLSALIAALSSDSAESFELASELDSDAICALVSALSSAVSRCADLVGTSYSNLALLRRDAALSTSSLRQATKDELRSLPLERSSLFGSAADAVLQRAAQAVHDRALDRIAEGFPRQAQAPKRTLSARGKRPRHRPRKMPRLQKVTPSQPRRPPAASAPRASRGRPHASGKRQHPQ